MNEIILEEDKKDKEMYFFDTYALFKIIERNTN